MTAIDIFVQHESFISVPERESKPRITGLTCLIDTGLATGKFEDVIRSHHPFIDYVKFGWGTALVTTELERKIACLRQHDVDFFFGGTLFEKAAHQRKLDLYYNFLKRWNCRNVEISNGTLPMTNSEKARHIRDFSHDFRVFSEVGFKDSDKSETMYPAQWVEYILEDFTSGASKVITEAREGGSSGICRSSGELRIGLIEEIVRSIPVLEDLVFEAPTKTLQSYFVKRLGANVNLGNIAFTDVIALETLRLGIRSDTFFAMEQL